MDYKFGCVMLAFSLSKWEEFVSNLIDPNDVYHKNGLGLELEPHCTILYGIHTDEHPQIEIAQLLQTLTLNKKAWTTEIKNISLFENPEFDVVKFELSNPKLAILNQILKASFLHTPTHPIYKAHCTIAYCKKGTGQKYVKQLEKAFSLVPNKFKIGYPNCEPMYVDI